LGDEWIQKPNEVREAVVNYFKVHVSTKVWKRPKLDEVPLQRLTDANKVGLVVSFSLLEIEAIMKKIDGNKIPSLCVFNFAYIKAFWYLIKDGGEDNV